MTRKGTSGLVVPGSGKWRWSIDMGQTLRDKRTSKAKVQEPAVCGAGQPRTTVGVHLAVVCFDISHLRTALCSCALGKSIDSSRRSVSMTNTTINDRPSMVVEVTNDVREHHWDQLTARQGSYLV